jgi:hypothetical protein
MVMPLLPPGCSGSFGFPCNWASRSATTSFRTRSKFCRVSEKLFSGAMRVRLAPHGASKFSETRLARLVNRSI